MSRSQGGAARRRLPYPVEFLHRLNAHRWSRLGVADDDLPAIAALYGVDVGVVRGIEQGLIAETETVCAGLRQMSRKSCAQAGVRILAVGDSHSSDRAGYVPALARLWSAGGDAGIRDAAVPGDTTCHLIRRLGSTILNQDFDRAVLFVGTNDCSRPDESEGITAVSAAEYRRNLAYLARRIAARCGAPHRLVLVTLPPVDAARFRAFFAAGGLRLEAGDLEAANQTIRALAAERGYGLADLAAAIAGGGQEVLRQDGVHLNAAGHRLLAGLLLGLFEGGGQQ